MIRVIDITEKPKNTVFLFGASVLFTSGTHATQGARQRSLGHQAAINDLERTKKIAYVGV